MHRRLALPLAMAIFVLVVDTSLMNVSIASLVNVSIAAVVATSARRSAEARTTCDWWRPGGVGGLQERHRRRCLRVVLSLERQCNAAFKSATTMPSDAPANELARLPRSPRPPRRPARKL